MGTILNACKSARKESRQSDEYLKKEICVYEEHDDGIHSVLISKDNVSAVLSSCERSIAKNEMVIGELEKDSIKKEYYVKDNEKKQRFINELHADERAVDDYRQKQNEKQA